MKKILSVFLALALLTCLFTTALADTGAVELELKADDGTVAKAVFSDAYTAKGTLNIDGTEHEVTAVIVTDGTLTVDKPVSGTGYLWEDETPAGLPVLNTYGGISTAAGEHALAAFVDEKANTDSPFFAFSFYSEEWGADSVMMYDLITYSAPDGSLVYITFDNVIGTASEALELKADDGTVAKAVFSDSYTAKGTLNIDGTEREVTAVIVSTDGTLTVDKPVSGTGYLWEDETPAGMPVLNTYGGISTAAGEHALAAFVDGKANTDSPFFAYSFYSEEWGADSVMMYDLITYTAPDGSLVYITFADVLEPQSQTEPEPEPAAPSFSDVNPDAYYADAVAWAVEKNITSGTGDNTFSPDSACTRSQAVTFLWRAAGSPEPSSTVNPFSDVSPDEYYYKAVLWAVEKNITSGTSDTTFSPDLTCSRAQIVTFQWRNAGMPSVSGSSFSDVPGDAYYSSAVEWALQNGITSGTGGDGFNPDAECTRAQIVTFLYRDMSEKA